MSLKVVNYNILHGFFSGERPFRLEQERLETATRAVKAEDPDFLLLTEACFALPNEDKVRMNYAEIFDFPYGVFSRTRNEWGSAVLSKSPIVSYADFSMFRRGFLKSSIDLNGRTVNIDVVHPHPKLTESEKMRFLANCLRDMQRPYLIAGDLNAISDEDSYDLEELVIGFEGFHVPSSEFTTARHKVEDLMRKLTIPEIRRHGLIDTYNALDNPFDFTIPTDLLSKDKRSGIRIDYIFASPDFEVVDAGIIKNRYTNSASDHYPVFAVLELQ